MLTWIFSPFCSPLKKLKWVKHIGQGGTSKWVKWHCRQSSRPKSTWDGGWCRPTILLQPTAVYQQPAVFTPLCTSAPHTQPTYFSACPHLKEVQPGLFLCLSKFTKLCNCTHNLTYTALCRLLRQKHVPVNWREASILIKCIHHTQDSRMSPIGPITWPKIG